MSLHLDYYSEWRTQTLTCTCGWAGPGAAASSEMYAELLELRCPSCIEKILAMVSYPTSDDVRAAAAKGFPGAQADLERLLERERRETALESSRLQTTEQLPELSEDAIDIEWTIEEADGDRWWVLKTADQEVWRELAAWEDWPRVAEVEAVLVAKYGRRLRTLRLEDAATWLLGDRMGWLGPYGDRKERGWRVVHPA